MVIREIEKKSTKELNNLVSELKAQLFMLRFQNSTRQLEQPHKIQNVKKDIARVFTVLSQRKIKDNGSQQTKVFKVDKTKQKGEDKKIESAKEKKDPKQLKESK